MTTTYAKQTADVYAGLMFTDTDTDNYKPLNTLPSDILTRGVDTITTEITSILPGLFQAAKNMLIRSNLPAGVFYAIADKTVATPPDVLLRTIVAYLRIKFLQNLLSKTKYDITNLQAILETLIKNALYIVINITAYQEAAAAGTTGGGWGMPKPTKGKKAQKGGMDTAKMYNTQGLIEDIAAINNKGATVSPSMNVPAPFSVSSASALGGSLNNIIDTLPKETQDALLPPLIVGGAKKKVKQDKKPSNCY